MDKKKLGIIVALSTALMLTGCGMQGHSTNKSNATSSSLLAKKSAEKLSDENLTPEQTVSLIATYAGNRYGGQWASMVKQAQKSDLQVNIYPADKYQLSDQGQGVAYDVTAGGRSMGLVYTLNGNQVNIYRGVHVGKKSHKLSTIDQKAMIRYVNKYGQAKLVKDLAQKAQVIDKRSGDTDSANTTQSTSHQYGRMGTVTVPENMRGTWYSADDGENSTINFGAHQLTIDGQTNQLYKKDSNFSVDNESSATRDAVYKATENWSNASFWDVHDMHFLNLLGWNQEAGDGVSFAVHTETINGKQVKILVAAGGAEFWTERIYYQTQDLAKANADRKFDDLYYQ